MLVEIVGARVLAPVFGVGLFVWAALIAVTMGALAVGYYAGGAIADRHPTPKTLGVALLSAAATLAVAVFASRAVLGVGLAAGPRYGPLAGAMVLFSPALMALGAMGPIAVRLVTVDKLSTGQSVGRIYALSTLGSLLGALSVPFVLVPLVDTRALLLGGAAMLGVLSTFWLSASVRVFGVAVCLVCSLSALSDHSRSVPDELRVIQSVESPYGLLEVIDDHKRGIRLLRADHSVIGGRFMADHSEIFMYLRMLGALRVLRPEAKSMLQVGLGTGALATRLGKAGVEVDVVEIDPAVVSLARRYFNFTPSGELIIEDARTFLNGARKEYDLIVHDTFSGGSTPEHLLSLEMLHTVSGLLDDEGVFALNFFGFDRGPEAEATWAVVNTVKAVFAHVRVFRDSPRQQDAGATNLVIFAAQDELGFDEMQQVNRAMWSRFQAQEVSPRDSTALISDARNPLGRMQVPIAESHFEIMSELLPASIWLP